jgi:2'-5' RNA ligase
MRTGSFLIWRRKVHLFPQLLPAAVQFEKDFLEDWTLKAAFAFLTDTETHNLVRKLSWDIHLKYRTGIDICRLPPHISLKQPFDIANLTSLEDYMAELAASISPFEIYLTGLELIEVTIDGLETGILWLNVQESELLRNLHNRLHQELTVRFKNVSAPFDGPDYHFHMTVSIGDQPIEIYRKIYTEFSEQLNSLQYTVRELGMFVYDDRDDVNAGYIIYKIMLLGK